MLNLFTDHNVKKVISSTVHAYLQATGEGNCTELANKFPPNIADIVWINQLNNDPDDWVILSGDMRITKNKDERKVLENSGMFFFAITPCFSQLPREQQVARMIIVLEDIKNHISNPNNLKIVAIPVKGKQFKPL